MIDYWPVTLVIIVACIIESVVKKRKGKRNVVKDLSVDKRDTLRSILKDEPGDQYLNDSPAYQEKLLYLYKSNHPRLEESIKLGLEHEISDIRISALEFINKQFKAGKISAESQAQKVRPLINDRSTSVRIKVLEILKVDIYKMLKGILNDADTESKYLAIEMLTPLFKQNKLLKSDILNLIHPVINSTNEDIRAKLQSLFNALSIKYPPKEYVDYEPIWFNHSKSYCQPSSQSRRVKFDLTAKGFKLRSSLNELLFKSIIDNNESEVVSLIERGADINAKTLDGITPLILSVRMGQSRNSISELLIKHGAKVNAKTVDHFTPLMYASANGNKPIVKLLIRKGAKKNDIRSKPADMTAYDYAKKFDTVGVEKLLGETPVERNKPDIKRKDIIPVKRDIDYIEKPSISIESANRSRYTNLQKLVSFPSQRKNLKEKDVDEILKRYINKRWKVAKVSEGAISDTSNSKHGIVFIRITRPERDGTLITMDAPCSLTQNEIMQESVIDHEPEYFRKGWKLIQINPTHPGWGENKPYRYCGRMFVVLEKRCRLRYGTIIKLPNSEIPPINHLQPQTTFKDVHDNLGQIEIDSDNPANTKYIFNMDVSDKIRFAVNDFISFVISDEHANEESLQNYSWCYKEFYGINMKFKFVNHINILTPSKELPYIPHDDEYQISFVESTRGYPLHYFVAEGMEEAVRILVSQGYDVNIRDSKGVTALHIASKSGSSERVKFLVDNGAQIDATDYQGWTPLHRALQWGSDIGSKQLIKLGANIHAQTEAGFQPIHFASAESINYLVDAGVDINSKSKDGLTPLMASAWSRGQRLTSIHAFYKSGANMNDLCNKGNNVLHFYIKKCPEDIDAIALLIHYGVNCFAQNQENHQPMYYANTPIDDELKVLFGEDNDKKNGRMIVAYALTLLYAKEVDVDNLPKKLGIPLEQLKEYFIAYKPELL